EHPARLLRRLEAAAAGCRWLLDRWAELRAAMVEGPCWRPAQRLGAVRLLGKEPVDAVDDPMVQSIYLCSFVLDPDGPAVFADQVSETRTLEFDHFLARLAGRGARDQVPPSREAAKEGLLALVDGIMAVLEVRSAGHAERSAADRVAFDTGAAGERLQRLQI